MKFPNAFSGVKKLFLAELFNIISATIMFVSAVFALFVTDDASPDNHAAGFFALIALSFVSVVFGIVAFVLQIVGANQARRDERMFKKAIYFVIICVICTLAMAFGSGMFNKISAGIDEVSTLLIHVYVIMGIFGIADQLENTAMQSRGKLTLLLITAAFAVAFVLQLVGAFMPEIAEPLSIVSAVIEFVSYIILLIYLGAAKKMFAA